MRAATAGGRAIAVYAGTHGLIWRVRARSGGWERGEAGQPGRTGQRQLGRKPLNMAQPGNDRQAGGTRAGPAEHGRRAARREG